MNGTGIAAALDLGAVAAQLGTAFIACPKSGADDAYRTALAGPGAYHTALTSLISGGPARALANRLTALAQEIGGRLGVVLITLRNAGSSGSPRRIATSAELSTTIRMPSLASRC